jgi:hypothetical protein
MTDLSAKPMITRLGGLERKPSSGVYVGMRTAGFMAAILCVSAASGCSPDVDLTRALQLESVATGWYEASSSEGRTKLVPAVTLKLRNVSDRTLRTLQVNAVFRRVTEDTQWGSGFRTVVGSTGLLPANTSGAVFVPSELGYVGAESRLDMLKNSQFVDARVDIFARYGASRWAPMGRYPIARQLIQP